MAAPHGVRSGLPESMETRIRRYGHTADGRWRERYETTIMVRLEDGRSVPHSYWSWFLCSATMRRGPYRSPSLFPPGSQIDDVIPSLGTPEVPVCLDGVVYDFGSMDFFALDTRVLDPGHPGTEVIVEQWDPMDLFVEPPIESPPGIGGDAGGEEPYQDMELQDDSEFTLPIPTEEPLVVTPLRVARPQDEAGPSAPIRRQGPGCGRPPPPCVHVSSSLDAAEFDPETGLPLMTEEEDEEEDECEEFQECVDQLLSDEESVGSCPFGGP